MLDLKIKLLFDNLSLSDDKKRIESVKELYEIYKNNDQCQEYIINRLVKGLATIRPQPRKGFFNTFYNILQALDEKSFESAISKIKEHLFITELESGTKSELTAIKLGSILAFDGLVMSNRLKDVANDALDYFFTYIFNLVSDNLFGFISVEVLTNCFKFLSKKQFEKLKALIKKEYLQLDQLTKYPQFIILWLGILPEQKKILRSANKIVPSLQANETIITMLPKLLRSCKNDQMLLIFNYLLTSPANPAILKMILDTYLKPESDLKEKQIILLMAFETIIPQKNGPISKLTIEQRQLIINIIWENEQFLNHFYKQLSSPDVELHAICTKFSQSLNVTENTLKNPLLEYVFKKLLATNSKNIQHEIQTNQSFRMSHNLLRHVDDLTLCEHYSEILKSYYELSEKDNEKMFIFEEMTSLATKIPISTLEFLLKINIRYNHTECNNSKRIIEAAKSAYLRCLEPISITDLERLKNLLLNAKSLCETGSPIISTIESTLSYWDTIESKNKKRTALDRDRVTMDASNPIDSMFVATQAHICLYMMCQPYDEETIDMLGDLKSCLVEFKGCSDNNKIVTKKARNSVTKSEENPDKNWKLVLTDILTLFMEQNCHYLRSLSANVFKVFVTEGYCDSKVLNLIKDTIKDINVEINGVDNKPKAKLSEDVHMSDDDNEAESACDSQDSEDEDSDDEDSENNEKENAIKARISAALSLMKADVDSDADDNCPDDVSNIASSDDDDKCEDKKVTLKDKRFTILQLRQFRNRCFDLLDIVILKAPRLSVRMAGFVTYLELLTKSDTEAENHLVKTMASFKSKYHPKEGISTKDIVDNINCLITAVEKCHQTKDLVTAFSDVMITLLRLGKSDIVKIAEQFSDIIENCITNKKNHPIKAVFLAMFDKIPEFGWAFYGQVLKYVGEEQSKIVQYRALEILRKIVQNPAMKHSENGQLSISKDEINQFVVSLLERVMKIVVSLDLTSNLKHTSNVVGLIIDCLKLCPQTLTQITDVTAKVMALKTVKVSKELKKTVNQYQSASRRTSVVDEERSGRPSEINEKNAKAAHNRAKREKNNDERAHNLFKSEQRHSAYSPH